MPVSAEGRVENKKTQPNGSSAVVWLRFWFQLDSVENKCPIWWEKPYTHNLALFPKKCQKSGFNRTHPLRLGPIRFDFLLVYYDLTLDPENFCFIWMVGGGSVWWIVGGIQLFVSLNLLIRIWYILQVYMYISAHENLCKPILLWI